MNPNPQILISLSKNRNQTGVLTISANGVTKQYACLGKSDNAAAAAHGNPERDPLKPFGDIPFGVYRGIVTIAGQPLRSFGPSKRILLVAVSGDALKACTGNDPRWGLMIHAGDAKPDGGLRPTHGCVRVSNETMAELISLIEAHCGAGELAVDVTISMI